MDEVFRALSARADGACPDRLSGRNGPLSMSSLKSFPETGEVLPAS
jgi:hypothetical protein